MYNQSTMMNMVNPYHANYGDDQALRPRRLPGARMPSPGSTPACSTRRPPARSCSWAGGTSAKRRCCTTSTPCSRRSALGIYVPLRQVAPREGKRVAAGAGADHHRRTGPSRATSSAASRSLIRSATTCAHWLEVTFLPQILGAVRRKLLILLDDVDRLLMAVRDGQLPEDTFTYLLSLTQKMTALYFAADVDSGVRGRARRPRAAGRPRRRGAAAPTSRPTRPNGCCKRPCMGCIPSPTNARSRCSARSAARRAWCSTSATSSSGAGKLPRTERLHAGRRQSGHALGLSLQRGGLPRPLGAPGRQRAHRADRRSAGGSTTIRWGASTRRRSRAGWSIPTFRSTSPPSTRPCAASNTAKFSSRRPTASP